MTPSRESRRVVAEPTELATAANTPNGPEERGDAGTTIGWLRPVRGWQELCDARRRGERPTHGCCARCGKTGELVYAFDGRLAIVQPGAERATDTG